MVELLGAADLFESGARTAGRTAKQAKSNLQGDPSHPEIAGVIEKVRTDLSQQALFKQIALPRRFARVMVSRYEPGMTYGAHFDDAFIDGVRTDLSFTVFLTQPDSYVGGELQLITPTGEQAIKLPAGCAIVYPSDQLHAVLPVTEGVRLAVVGWVQSRVPSAQHRQLLFELHQTTESLAAQDASPESILQLRHVHNNLLRLWAES